MKKTIIALFILIASVVSVQAETVHLNIGWGFDQDLEQYIVGFEIYYRPAKVGEDDEPVIIDSSAIPSDRSVSIYLDVEYPRSEFFVVAVYDDGTRVFSQPGYFTHYQPPVIKYIDPI